MSVFLQVVLGLCFAFISAYISVVLSRFLRQNGTVLNRIEELLARMDEGFGKMDERAEQRHREVMESLKKGFGKSAS